MDVVHLHTNLKKSPMAVYTLIRLAILKLVRLKLVILKWSGLNFKIVIIELVFI